jgi:tRNA pseudouridine38-40 synthase
MNTKKMIAVINSNLPKDIRVFAIKKVTKSFDIRKKARSRVYEYLIPITLF